MTLPVDQAPGLTDGPPGRNDGPKTGRRADIQGLRAIAVLLVVAFHAGLPLPGGFIGVDMFFVISGFVIGGLLLPQLQETAALGFATFYARRMRRLLPALALVIVFVAAASTLLLSPLGPQQATAKTGIAASLFSANFQLLNAGGGYFDLAAETNALLHTWSLSVEEQFYFVFPAFLLVAWRFAGRFTARRSRRRTTAALVLVATAVSFAVSCYTSYQPGRFGTKFAFYSPVTRAWEFGVGVLLALALPGLFRLTRRFAGALALFGAALVAIGAVAITDTTNFPGFAALLPVIGTAAMLVAGAATSRGVTSVLAIRPAVWVGDVSYGWYLWHWPLIVFAAALWPRNDWVLVVAAVGSLAPTWLSYRFVENPIRFNNRLTGRRVVPLVVVCLAVPIAASLGLLLTNRVEVRTDAVKRYSTVTRAFGADKSGCDTAQPFGEQPDTACTWPVDDPRGSVVLIGDSNAAQFTDPVAKAANELGYDFTMATMDGCPFADVVRDSQPDAGFDGPACHRFVTESVAGLTRSPPALVIMATSSPRLLNFNDSLHLTDPRTGQVATTPSDKAKVYEDGLASVLGKLADAAIPTLVVHPIPHLRDDTSEWQAAACPAVRIFARSCGLSEGRGQVEHRQQRARDAENRAVARVPGTASTDFTDDLCSATSCVTPRHGLWLYRDATHLSVDGALTLTDHFRQLIADHAAGGRA